MGKKNEMKDVLNTCKEYIQDIIPAICSILDEKKIEYKNTENEIYINIDDVNDEKKIKSIILSTLPIPKVVVNILVEIIKVDSVLYIRKKIK